MKVGYLGPKGTFSYEICNKVYPNEEKIPFKTIKETILELSNNNIEEAIVPIENSLQGCVTETLDTIIQNKDIIIKAERNIKIRQNLMAKENYKLEQIKEIYSHPQALSQCRDYIFQNLKNAEVMQSLSTALAASEVSKKEYTACIGNKECIKEYNLKLLKEDIQDNDFNETKFWILSKKAYKIENANKITMIFTTENKPGALYNALEIFHNKNINLTKIESRPTKNKLGEYYFLIDIEFQGENYKTTIDAINHIVGFYRILGIYKKQN